MDRQQEAETLGRKDDIDDKGSLKSGEEGNTTTLSSASPGLEHEADFLFNAVQRIQQSVTTLLTEDKAEQSESGKGIDKVA